MVVLRKRLIFWLIKAYIKKSGKTLLFSFLAGLAIFFILLFAARYITKILPTYRRSVVGLVGAYTEDQLPPLILDKLSEGLTSVAADGTIKPALAASWKIGKDGKVYTFYLRHNQYFSDGKPVTSSSITYNFSDVMVSRPDIYTIVFTLKDTYAPFLVTVSQPIFRNGFTGIGKYTVQNITLNGDFVQSLTLVSKTSHFDTIRYQFYPTVDALKMAFLLGQINQAIGLTDPNYKNVSLANFPNAIMT